MPSRNLYWCTVLFGIKRFFCYLAWCITERLHCGQHATAQSVVAQQAAMHLGLIFRHGFAGLHDSSVELIVRLTHQDCQLPELGQQSIVVIGQIRHLVTLMPEFCPQDGLLLL